MIFRHKTLWHFSQYINLINVLKNICDSCIDTKTGVGGYFTQHSTTTATRTSTRGVVVNKQNCDILVSKFELYDVTTFVFELIPFGKIWNNSIYGWNSTATVLLQGLT